MTRKSEAPYAIVARRIGGPEVLEVEPVAPGNPGPGEVLLRQEAVGVNFIDTYHRSGLYPLPLPMVPGSEGAGVIEAVGKGVVGFAAGDRVAYAGARGAYASHRLIPARHLVRLPDGISTQLAAAALLKGCTAEFLVERCAKVQPGQWVLVHAAAGGVGSILVQWLKAIGAHVIAHAGSEAKAARAKALGADDALDCAFDELAGEVRRITGGEGVPVVLDGVGAASWHASLASVARRGLLVIYGNASGAVPDVSPLALMRAGSVFLTRPTLFDYHSTQEEMRASAERLFQMLKSGAITVDVGARFDLRQAAEAHRALEARQTTGSVLLMP